MSASWPASGHGLHSGEEAGSPKMTMSQDVVTRFGRALPVRQRPGAWWRGWLFSSGRMPVPPPAGRVSPVREASIERRHHAHAETINVSAPALLSLERTSGRPPRVCDAGFESHDAHITSALISVANACTCRNLGYRWAESPRKIGAPPTAELRGEGCPHDSSCSKAAHAAHSSAPSMNSYDPPAGSGASQKKQEVALSLPVRGAARLPSRSAIAASSSAPSSCMGSAHSLRCRQARQISFPLALGLKSQPPHTGQVSIAADDDVVLSSLRIAFLGLFS